MRFANISYWHFFCEPLFCAFRRGDEKL